MTTKNSEELGFTDLLIGAWRARWWILLLIIVFSVAGYVGGWIITKRYRAEVLISPVADSPTGGGGALSGLANQYGALASLAGLSLSGRSSNNKDESIAVLQSQLITEAYIRDNELLPVLYADLWDSAHKQWKTDDIRKKPTLWKANQAFKSIRDVKLDAKTGLVTLRITWTNAETAARWANDLVRDTNCYLREKAITESEKNIAYLNLEAANTNILEAKAAIFSILKDEVNKQMIAKGREEYALKVIDPAEPPERPSTPGRLVTTLVGFVLACLLSAMLVLYRSALFRTARA